MAKYSFTVSGSQLIVSLVPVLDDVQPTSMSYLAPSFKIGVGKINAYEYGQPKQSFLFTEIGEIDGVAPTDLQDAFDKITTATANFNGGGAAPYKVYTALLSQSGTDVPVATVLENTLGDISFDVDSEGVYLIKSTSLFTVNKTAVFFTNSLAYNSNINRVDEDTIILDVSSSDNMSNSTVEIRVYN